MVVSFAEDRGRAKSIDCTAAALESTLDAIREMLSHRAEALAMRATVILRRAANRPAFQRSCSSGRKLIDSCAANRTSHHGTISFQESSSRIP